MKKIETRKAFIRGKDGKKYGFDMPSETAEKVLRLQKMIKEQRAKKKKSESD